MVSAFIAAEAVNELTLKTDQSDRADHSVTPAVAGDDRGDPGQRLATTFRRFTWPLRKALRNLL